jgi:HEAT repeat protein
LLRRNSLSALIAVVFVAIPSAQSFPTVEAFKAATPAQKVTALEAIASGRMAMPAGVLDQYVTIALADADARVREHGSAALSWFEARRAVRPEAAGTLTPELTHHEPTLRKLVSDDSDARVRSFALSALAYLRMTKPLQLADDVIPLVIERVQKERDGLARMSAIGLLINTPGPEVTSALLNATGDGVPAVRAKAIEVIGLQRIASAIPRLVEMLTKDADWFPRWHAARALGRLAPDSRSVVAAVEARAKLEPDARVREEIAKTLAVLRR